MKRDWLFPSKANPIPEEKTINYYIEGTFGKGYKTPYKAGIYRQFMRDGVMIDPDTGREMDPNNLSRAFIEKHLKPAFAKHTLVDEVYDFINGTMAMNAYKYTRETMNFYMRTAQAMLMGSIADDDSLTKERKNALIESIEKYDVGKHGGRKNLLDAMEEHSVQLRNYTSKPVTYDMMQKSPIAWVMLHEGGFAPFVKGMPLLLQLFEHFFNDSKLNDDH